MTWVRIPPRAPFSKRSYRALARDLVIDTACAGANGTQLVHSYLVAQLEERSPRDQSVMGSNPT